jgi:hypothetical protein
MLISRSPIGTLQRNLSSLLGNRCVVVVCSIHVCRTCMYNRSTGVSATDPLLSAFGGDGTPDDNCLSKQSSTSVATSVFGGGCNCTLVSVFIHLYVRWLNVYLMFTMCHMNDVCHKTEGPFAGWATLGSWGEQVGVLTRAFACLNPTLPTSAFVDYITTLPRFYETNGNASFGPSLFHGGTNSIESSSATDVHAHMHSWIGGTMSTFYNPSDPLFLVSHVYIDLVFERWIHHSVDTGVFSLDNSLPSGADAYLVEAGRARDECQCGIFPLHTHAYYFRPGSDLGFTYDYFPSATTSSTVSTTLKTDGTTSTAPHVAQTTTVDAASHAETIASPPPSAASIKPTVAVASSSKKTSVHASTKVNRKHKQSSTNGQPLQATQV